jgi:shikimate dehydrogenase
MTSGVRGLNVTLPHKQAAAELVNELTPRAARAQAVNTIAFFENTTLLGDNTDGVGLITDLTRNLEIDLADKRVLILGAGGAARGVVGPLLERELRSLTIANRTPYKARKLAAEFSDVGQIEGCTFGEIKAPAYDLIVNATSAGLQGEMPLLPEGLVGESTVCYDMTYGRGDTPFTLWAGAHHAGLISKGWGMLVEQAAESFMLWRGIRPNTQPVLEALQS